MVCMWYGLETAISSVTVQDCEHPASEIVGLLADCRWSSSTISSGMIIEWRLGS